VTDYEEHFDRLAEGKDVEGIYYQGITGMKEDMSGARLGPAIMQQRPLVEEANLHQSAATQEPAHHHVQGSVSRQGAIQQSPDQRDTQAQQHADSDSDASSVDESDGTDSAPSDTGSAADGLFKPKQDQEASLTKEQIKEQRKEHKRMVKEANKERRKHKLPKHVKKAKVNKGKHK
jgi:RIO kinase 1